MLEDLLAESSFSVSVAEARGLYLSLQQVRCLGFEPWTEDVQAERPLGDTLRE